ncbi:hypothetical protein GDO81_009658 [Engystomops pustulosus]|uniref:Uncharacterized protein n=1 Tax=Engystomops pustulosus TaxID=76066 RepID=A0AAV7BTS0_ENGPU|nr:hypothetical protein GDO81_009658 [Engystomops pustulosus]
MAIVIIEMHRNSSVQADDTNVVQLSQYTLYSSIYWGHKRFYSIPLKMADVQKSPHGPNFLQSLLYGVHSEDIFHLHATFMTLLFK